MRTRVKICCMASPEEALLAVAAGADAVGMVGARPPTPRTVPDRSIAAIVRVVPPPVATVLLSTEHTADAIAAQIGLTGPSTVQITQHIDARESVRLAEIAPHIRRIQVIHIGGDEALDLIPLYAPNVHAFLLDSGRPGSNELGGTGRVHDWAISARFVAASPLPVFLAGGLRPDNAAEAIRQVRPFGLDLCTGVRSDGRLDPSKLAAFMRAVRVEDARPENSR